MAAYAFIRRVTARPERSTNWCSTATPRDGQAPKDITIGLDETLPLDADTTVRLAEFIPDYVVSDGQVYARSNDLENPAAHLVVESKKSGQAVNVWLPPIPGLEQNASSPYAFEGKDVQMAYFTGLEVSHEPGQWAVWAGVVVMGFGLARGLLFRPHAGVGCAGARCAAAICSFGSAEPRTRIKMRLSSAFANWWNKSNPNSKFQSKAGAEAPVAALAGK